MVSTRVLTEEPVELPLAPEMEFCAWLSTAWAASVFAAVVKVAAGDAMVTLVAAVAWLPLTEPEVLT